MDSQDNKKNTPLPSFEELADQKPSKPAAPASPAAPSNTDSVPQPRETPAPARPSIAAPATPAASAPKSPRLSTPTPKPVAQPKIDPSISIDEGSGSTNSMTILIDALVAAAAIAFTVLILQETLPFLQ